MSSPAARRVRSGAVTRCACGAEWTGTRTCHCSACHQTFTGVGPFDAHRSGYGPRGACKAPARIGLHRNAQGRWGTAETE